MTEDTNKYQEATFGAGCFWCTEAVFQRLQGVKKIEPGFTGGDTKNPTYKQVCSGTTGHVEVSHIVFDPAIISYDQLLNVFWHTHNPTTLNRQGADVGTQYRSVIFYHTEEQKKKAEASKKETDQSDLWPDPIVTAIEPLEFFYNAENYHQNYYNENPNAGYCSTVIAPKIQKLHKEFGELIKIKD